MGNDPGIWEFTVLFFLLLSMFEVLHFTKCFITVNLFIFGRQIIYLVKIQKLSEDIQWKLVFLFPLFPATKFWLPKVLIVLVLVYLFTDDFYICKNMYIFHFHTHTNSSILYILFYTFFKLFIISDLWKSS